MKTRKAEMPLFAQNYVNIECLPLRGRHFFSSVAVTKRESLLQRVAKRESLLQREKVAGECLTDEVLQKNSRLHLIEEINKSFDF